MEEREEREMCVCVCFDNGTSALIIYDHTTRNTKAPYYTFKGEHHSSEKFFFYIDYNIFLNKALLAKRKTFLSEALHLNNHFEFKKLHVLINHHATCNLSLYSAAKTLRSFR